MIGVREVYAEVAAEQALQPSGLILKVEQRRSRRPRVTYAAEGHAPAEELAREVVTARTSGMARPTDHVDLRRGDPVTGIAIDVRVFSSAVSESGALFGRPPALSSEKVRGGSVGLRSLVRARVRCTRVG